MHCIVFCIHLAILQSYLSLFSHIPCLHFAKLGTQLDFKIDWLIFESLYILVYAIFYVWTAEILFLRDMMDNNVQIFSILMQLFMGHIVSSLHLLKERIFLFMCILNIDFKFGLCVFIFPTSKILPKTFFVFPICIGREACFWYF